MLRRLFTLASALSLVLFVGTAVLWVRSYWVADTFIRTLTRYLPNGVSDPDDPEHLGARALASIRSITFDRGHAIVRLQYRDEYLDRDSFLSLPKDSFGAHYAWQSEPPSIDHHLHFWTIYWWSGFSEDAVTLFTPPPHRETDIGFPLWMVAAIFAVLPLRRVVVTLQSRRPGADTCTACGYDLRATVDRCPECGHVPEKVKA